MNLLFIKADSSTAKEESSWIFLKKDTHFLCSHHEYQLGKQGWNIQSVMDKFLFMQKCE